MGCLRLRGTARAIDVGKIIHVARSHEFRSRLYHRVLGTVIGDTFPNHNNSSYYRDPTFYYTGILEPLAIWVYL